MANDTILPRRALAGAGAFIVVSSLALPWLSARSASHSYSYGARSLPVFPWVILGLVAVALASNFLSTSFSRSWLDFLSAALASVIFLSPIVTVISINLASTWATPAIMPSTFRRVLIGVTPASGLWLALFGGLLMVIAAIDKAPDFLRTLRSSSQRLATGDRTVIAVILAVTGAILYLESRYQPWITLSIATTTGSPERWPIPGFALPIIGIVSNFEIIAIIVCAVWQISRPSLGTATALTIIGFAPAFYGAIGACMRLVPSDVSFRIPNAINSTISQWAPTAERLSNGYMSVPHLRESVHANFQIGQGSTFSLAAGLIVTLAGLILIHTHKNEGNQS